MDSIKKYRIQIFLILFICVFSIAITGYFVVNQTPEHLIKEEPPLLVCGNETEKSGNATEKNSDEKEVFNAYCASCHLKNYKIVGPALYPTDSTTLWHWLNGKNHEIDTSKLAEMSIDYHLKIGKESLDSSHLKLLLSYLTN